MDDSIVLRDRSVLPVGVTPTLARCASSLGRIDILTAGYPCQRFSTAARGRNNARDFWPEALRIIRELRPRWVVLENVPGQSLVHIERSCRDLGDNDYAVWPIDIAIEVRNHVRRRIWVVAHSNRESEPQLAFDAEMASLSEIARQRRREPEPLGMDDGLSRRMDRQRAIGNSIEPEIAEMIFRAITTLSSAKA